MSVEVLAGPVVAHGRARIGVTGSDLDIAQVDAGVQHRGDERVPQHVWMHPGQPHVRRHREAAQAALLTKHFGGVVGHEVTRPIGTVTAIDHHALTTATLTREGCAKVDAFLSNYAPANNQTSCLGCHNLPTGNPGGGTPEEMTAEVMSAVARLMRRG